MNSEISRTVSQYRIGKSGKKTLTIQDTAGCCPVRTVSVFSRVLLFSLVLLFLLLWGDRARAAEEKRCPSEDTLTRSARVALVEAQKQIKEENISDAQKILVEFTRTYPDENHPYIAFTLASLFVDKNSLASALDQYEKAVEMCPSYALAWQNIGAVCFDLKKFDKAAGAMEKTWEFTGKKEYKLLYHAAVAHVSAGSKKKALGHLDFLTSGRAGEPELKWVQLMVNLSIEEDRAEKAVLAVEKLLDKSDPHALYFKMAAMLYLNMNKYRKAAEALALYGMVSSLTVSEQTLLADLYNNLGIPFKAAELYEKVLEKNPEKKLYGRLVSAWVEACMPEKALAGAEKGVTLFPDCPRLWKLKAWIHYDNNAFSQASTAFLKAYQLNKGEVKLLFMHGLCACRAGKDDMAREALKKVSAAGSEYKEQALALIRQMEKKGRSS